MNFLIEHKLLNIPAIVWVLQLLYVAVALAVFALIATKLEHRPSTKLQIIYVVIMVIINVIWRTALTKLRPNWF